MAQLPALGVGAEPAASPVSKGVDRGKEPRFLAELPGVLFCAVVFLQKGYLVPPKPQEAFLLVLGNADILDRVRRQAFLISPDGLHFAVTLDSTPPADGEGAQHSLFGAAGDSPGKQIQIGLFPVEYSHLDPHALQRRNAFGINKVPVFRDFA